VTTATETSAVTHMIAISEVEALELWSGLVIAGDVRHPGRRCRLGGQSGERNPDGDPALRDLTGNRVPMICCRAWTP